MTVNLYGFSCILFHFYIKPQLCNPFLVKHIVVSYSISTSNHNFAMCKHHKHGVVSYSISTSNHNCTRLSSLPPVVVSYSISTSNHNSNEIHITVKMLYLIPFLHQTTTSSRMKARGICCILFHFYIKPQQMWLTSMSSLSCILFHFYIKPQLPHFAHNGKRSCILFHFYIKPQLTCGCAFLVTGCILFHFYIKPQLARLGIEQGSVVSYSISTSNHNSLPLITFLPLVVSYSISTSNHNLLLIPCLKNELYLIPFLHQTTTDER